MLMPKKDRHAIYEYLFKEGICVAKKDFHMAKHRDIGVHNLYVIKAMQSLKSRDYVKEQFAWRHYYWMLTNEGMNYLREYLHLPPEIIPATLKRPQRGPDARGPMDRPTVGPSGKLGDIDSRESYRKAMATWVGTTNRAVEEIWLHCCFIIIEHEAVVELTRSRVQMDSLIERIYFSSLVCPNLKLSLPRWVQAPSAMMVYGIVLVIYFLITGGVIYDVINEPPSIGSTVDSRGNSRPVAFMAYRINGQYIMEGLAASFMFVLGGLGFVILDRTTHPSLSKFNRSMLLGFGIGSATCNSLSLELVQAYDQLKQEVDACFDRFARDSIQLKELRILYEKLDREENRQSNYNRSKLKASVQSFLKDCELQFASVQQVLREVQSAQRVLEAKKAEVMLSKHRGAKEARSSIDKQNGALRRCTLMLMLQKSAISIPVWVSISNDCAPPLCGAVPAAPDYVCKVGDLCVAKVKNDDYWILAEVKAYYSAQAKYNVEDIDEEQKERHILGRKKIIPLPVFRAHPALNPEALFEVNSIVLALYPQTTCFYRGIVQRRPPGPLDSYLIAFEDSSYPSGFSPPLTVPQRYVVSP
ncbi:hypothetical protein M514_27075 [Trichuris suis]|uniref:SGF29 C-terminal domain-containing protein n=1 Tax=Trichuris suis TaxID=68888 RepID=A0A085MU63_9BILA|nr:hypothetical protein M514_27075 [Trichuris suis]